MNSGTDYMARHVIWKSKEGRKQRSEPGLCEFFKIKKQGRSLGREKACLESSLGLINGIWLWQAILNSLIYIVETVNLPIEGEFRCVYSCFFGRTLMRKGVFL